MMSWYWRKTKKRLRRYGALIEFVMKMMLKPKGTVFTFKDEVVSRVEYLKGIVPLLKQK